ncbi:unnamed protein product [Zymoseptoria tritici ST99CH_1E4]|uniref:Uncharacterized protein n=1 Tax=Zymoseptoria tritici ST99CH_1E4 TaxID=1276532 RepID=A0A2H1H991_ZYMTR|nr:unnamed protein product [Zymoseptoria tritici ST99CH_1E4]
MRNDLLEAVETAEASVISNRKIHERYAALSKTFEKLEKDSQHIIEVQKETIAALRALRGRDKQRIAELEGVLDTVHASLVAAPHSTELDGGLDKQNLVAASARIAKLEGVLDMVHASLVAAPHSTELEGGLDKQNLGAASARIAKLEGVLDMVHASLVAAPHSAELQGGLDPTRKSLATTPLFSPPSNNSHHNPLEENDTPVTA